MTVSQPVQRVVDCLSTAGYRERESKTAIASVPFEFSAILVGSDRALDLIVVIDTLVEPELRIRQKVEGLGRALDLVTSRRPLTVILVGPAPKATTIQALSRVCRVLSVGTPTGPKADEYLTDALAVLLPLELPAVSDAIVDPLSDVRQRLGKRADDAAEQMVKALLEASSQGPEPVRETLRSELQSGFPSESSDGGQL